MEDNIAKLTQQLAEKEDIIALMKTKTKDYFKKLNEDHAAIISAKEASISALTEVSKGMLF